MTTNTPVNAGTVTLEQNTAFVFGVGTNWALTVTAGDDFRDVESGLSSIVAEVISDTALVLIRPWPVEGGSGREYDIIPRGDINTSAGNSTVLREILAKLDTGLYQRSDDVGTLAERDAFDGEAEGFVFVATDNQPRRDTYIKTGPTAQDWEGPFYPDTGPQGPAGQKGDKGNKGNKGDTGSRGEKGDGLEIDDVGDIAGRAAFDDSPKGFAYVDDVNGALYIKKSSASGDWSGAIPFTKTGGLNLISSLQEFKDLSFRPADGTIYTLTKGIPLSAGEYGDFVVVSGDYTELRSLDPFEGLFAPFGDALDGSQGGLLRILTENTDVFFDKFNLGDDYVSVDSQGDDCYPQFQSAINLEMAGYIPSKRLRIGNGRYRIDQTLTLLPTGNSFTCEGIDIIGQGSVSGNRTADQHSSELVFNGTWGDPVIRFAPGHFTYEILLADFSCLGGHIEIGADYSQGTIRNVPVRSSMFGHVLTGNNYTFFIENCWAYNITSVGLDIRSSNHVRVDNFGMSNAGFEIGGRFVIPPNNIGLATQKRERARAGIRIGLDDNCICINIFNADIEAEYLQYKYEILRTNVTNLYGDYIEGRGDFTGPTQDNAILGASDFSNAAWIPSRLSVSEDQLNDSEGNLTLDGLIANTENNSHQIQQSIQRTFVGGVTRVVMDFVVAKGVDDTFAVLLTGPAFNTTQQLRFDITNLTAVTQTGICTARIEPIDGTLYRCVIQGVVENNASDINVFFRLQYGSFVGDGVNPSIFVGEVNAGIGSQTAPDALIKIGDPALLPYPDVVNIYALFGQCHSGTYQDGMQQRTGFLHIFAGFNISAQGSEIRRAIFGLKVEPNTGQIGQIWFERNAFTIEGDITGQEEITGDLATVDAILSDGSRILNSVSAINADPQVAGQMWVDNGTLKLSAG